MRKLLVALWVIQHKRVEDKNSPWPRFRTLRRLNPYNPLTYVVIPISLILGLLMFGFVGLWKEIEWSQLKFKWV
jgi:hypothetical protein